MASRHARRGVLLFIMDGQEAQIFSVCRVSRTNFKRGLRDPEREGGEIFGLIIDEQTRLFVRIWSGGLLKISYYQIGNLNIHDGMLGKF